jgi:hypothetical protein
MKQAHSKLLFRMFCALALGVAMGLAWASQGGTGPYTRTVIRLVTWEH